MDTSLPRPLLTTPQLLAWLGVTDFWLRERLASDPDFPGGDIANKGATRSNRRFDVDAVAKHLGLPAPTWVPIQSRDDGTDVTETPAAA